MHHTYMQLSVSHGAANFSNCRFLCDILTVKIGYWCFWFQKAVMVYEIHDDGAIAKDDRLLCGDQILEVQIYVFILYIICGKSTRFYVSEQTEH